MSEIGNGQKPVLINKESAISIGVVVMLVSGSFWVGQLSNRVTVLEAQAAPIAVRSGEIIERLARVEALLQVNRK